MVGKWDDQKAWQAMNWRMSLAVKVCCAHGVLPCACGGVRRGDAWIAWVQVPGVAGNIEFTDAEVKKYGIYGVLEHAGVQLEKDGAR